MELSAKLVSLRNQHELTQLDLAEKLNVSRQAVSRWESGAAAPGVDSLKALSKLYGVSLDYLLNDDAEESPKAEEAPIVTNKEQSLWKCDSGIGDCTMDKNIAALLEKYRWLVPDQPVPMCQVIEKLSEELHATQMEHHEIPSLRMHLYNAINLPSNEILRLSDSDLNIQAIKIPISSRTSHYVERDFVSLPSKEIGNDFIYLAYEEQVGYHYSNSRLLFLQATLMEGISLAELAIQGEVYMDFAFRLKCFDEFYSSLKWV